MPKSKTKSDSAILRTLIRVAISAYLSADELLLRSAEIELANYDITLADLGIYSSEKSGVDRG